MEKFFKCVSIIAHIGGGVKKVLVSGYEQNIIHI